jgi:hypothetical protein
VIREAIRKEGMVAIGKVLFTSREHIIALEARGKGLLGVTLRYPRPQQRRMTRWQAPAHPARSGARTSVRSLLTFTSAGNWRGSPLPDSESPWRCFFEP